MGDYKGGAGRQSGSQRSIIPPAANAPQVDYRTFADDTAAYAFMDEHYRTRTMELDSAEQQALRLWSGSYSEGINLYLRAGNNLDEDSRTVLTRLDKVFARKKIRVDHDLMVKRSFGSYLNKIKELPVGTVLTDNGFAPVSVNPGRVNWGDENLYPAVTIRVPRGTSGVWMRPHSTFKEEGELLLKRGTSFKIVQNDAGGIVLDVVGQK